MSYRIYIHDGRAHMDELLACALYIIARDEAPLEIFRVQNDKATFYLAESEGDKELDSVFIDCAEHFDPARMLFDHHQDATLPSAAKLVFDEFFSELADTELSAWVDWVSDMDTRGPRILNKLGLDREVYAQLSAGQKVLLGGFENLPFETLAVFTAGLRDKIALERKIKEAAVWLEANSKTVAHNGDKLLELLSRPPKDLAKAAHAAESKLVDSLDIIAVYSFDKEREDVRKLFRTHRGDNKLDFTKSTPSKTLFCHNNGFLLKFRPADPSEWLAIITESRI